MMEIQMKAETNYSVTPTKPRVLFADARVSLAEHAKIARHFVAMGAHAGEILLLLDGRLRAPAAYKLLRFIAAEGAIGWLRSDLERDMFREHGRAASLRCYYERAAECDARWRAEAEESVPAELAALQ
jgi:hypothetical protein